MFKTKKDKGKKGEDIAADFLKRKGYKILERNYFPRVRGPLVGEIDIIAKDQKEVVFVEVKASFKKEVIPPEERVNIKKLKKIWHTARLYLLEKKLPSVNWRIDVIAIEKEGEKIYLRHVKNVSISWNNIF